MTCQVTGQHSEKLEVPTPIEKQKPPAESDSRLSNEDCLKIMSLYRIRGDSFAN